MEYTIVGKIINTHGIKGQVKVEPITSDIDRFSHLEKAYIGDKKLEVKLQSVRYHKGFVILKFDNYDDINLVLSFKNQFIYVNDEDRIILPEKHYFLHDLMGCNVVDTAGNKLGHIIDIMQSASNDIYVLKDNMNNKEYLIPAVNEFIKDVNIQKRIVTIDPIEGMIEWKLIF